MPQSEKLLEAHIKYELDSWKGENLKKNLAAEIDSMYDTLSDVSVSDFVDKKVILDFAKTFFATREIQKEEEEIIMSISGRIHAMLDGKKDSLTSLFPKSIFEDAMDMGLGMKELRKDVVHTIINSTVYTKMISSVMYNAIADFVGGENAFAKNVPGASSLFKMGQGILGGIPGMQAGIEKNLTSFIQSNLQNSLKQSEKLLNLELDSATTKELTDEVWNFLGTKSISDLQHYADPDDFKRIFTMVSSEWEHIKNSSLLTEILESHIDEILSRYKGKKLGEVFVLYNIKKTDITENLIKILEANMMLPQIQAHILKRISKRLEGFYNSPQAKAILK